MSTGTSATDSHLDPFVGASDLLRLVFGDAFSIVDEHNEQGTPPGIHKSSPSGHLLLTKSVVQVDVTPGSLPIHDLRNVVKAVHFRDFMGVPEDSDPDILVLWQLKDKYRRNAPQNDSEAGNGSSSVHKVRSPIQASDTTSSFGHRNTTDGPSGEQRAAILGWEPSEGDSLPLVDISFDSSIFGQKRPTLGTSKVVTSPNNNESPPTIHSQPGHSGHSLNLEKALNASLVTNDSKRGATSSMEGGGDPHFKRTGPSKHLFPAEGIATDQRMRGTETNFMGPQPIRPPSAQVSQPSSRMLSLTRTSTEEQPTNVGAVNTVRKLHGLVPPHLAKSITKNTLKAREDESLRLRLQQQEGMRLPQNAMQSDGRIGELATRSIEKPVMQRQVSGVNRGLPSMPAPPNGSRPYPAPTFASTMPTAWPGNAHQTTYCTPLAVARQVSVSLLTSRAINNVPEAKFSDQGSITSATSQTSAIYKSQGHAQTSSTGLTAPLPHDNGTHLTSASKENEPVNMVPQASGGQLKLQPLSTSQIANSAALPHSSPSEALRTLKRAWSDAEVGHFNSGIPVEKRLRLL